MSTSPTLDQNATTIAEPSAAQTLPAPRLLICLPSLPSPSMQTLVQHASAAFPQEQVLIASPDQATTEQVNNVRLLPNPTAHPRQDWVLTAGDYLGAGTLAREHSTEAVLLLGSQAASMTMERMRSMVELVLNKQIDVVLPRPQTAPGEGLVNSALLYPLTRALFATDIRFPLPAEAALSQRMAQRLSTTAQRLNGSGQSDALLWPVPEAAVAGFSVREVAAAELRLPHAPQGEFNSLFAAVAGSLFADIEAKATYWQRARSIVHSNGTFAAASSRAVEAVSDEVLSLVDAYRLAYANLHEIWSLVLPPQTLLALKRLSLAAPPEFAIAPSLWARIVYDFTLAHRLRTLNRGHLLGAFTPLYLAWVASHMRAADEQGAQTASLVSRTAAAFETEKPYLVSRWRWPDRFNP